MRLAYLQPSAPIAQLVEHLICNQGVGSSSLSGGTTSNRNSLFKLGFLAETARAQDMVYDRSALFSFIDNGICYFERRVSADLLEHYLKLKGVAADIPGHDWATMRYGVYSGLGSVKQKRKAIMKSDFGLD